MMASRAGFSGLGWVAANSPITFGADLINAWGSSSVCRTTDRSLCVYPSLECSSCPFWSWDFKSMFSASNTSHKYISQPRLYLIWVKQNIIYWCICYLWMTVLQIIGGGKRKLLGAAGFSPPHPRWVYHVYSPSYKITLPLQNEWHPPKFEWDSTKYSFTKAEWMKNDL